MEQAELIEFARQALVLTLMISTPVMVVGLAVGVVISLLQALTQIQESTLSFVPKVVVIFGMIFLLMPVALTKMSEFMDQIATKIISMN